MKNLKHILCILLAVSMLFAVACGGVNDESGMELGIGRYEETDISPPIEGRFTSFLSDDGTIVCFDEGLSTRYDSADGGVSWNDSPGPGRGSDRYQFIQSGTLLPDGSLLVFIQGEGLELISPDGSGRHYPAEEIDKAIEGGENVMMTLLQALDNRLLISYMIGGFMQQTRGGGPVGGGGNAPQGAVQRVDGPGAGTGPVTQSSSQGDSQGNPQGGAQGNPQDGSQGNPQGGAQVNPQGGSQGNPQGGAQGNPQDGSQGNPQGGAQGNPQGDTQGNPQGVSRVSPQGNPQDSTQGGSRDPQGNFQGRVIGEGPGDTPDEQSDEQSDEQPGNTYRGTVSTQMNSKTLLCDLSSGQVIADLPIENATSAVSRDNSFYLMDSSGNVSIYNLSDGGDSGKPEVRFAGTDDPSGPGGPGGPRGIGMRMGGMGGSTLALSSDGGLFAVLDGSLLLADADGNISTALERTSYSIGAPRSSVTSVFALDDGSIVVNILSNGMVNRLYKYAWNENAVIDPEKTLTIWSLHDNNFVRAAISELRKKHPDSLIDYEIALGRNSAVSASDAIKTLNTRLLSGDGPDVILLDGCSADSYADRDMLLDMSGLVETGDVFGGLLAPYKNNGKLYCLPTQFLMPMLMGSAEALADVKSLDDLIDKAVNGNDLPARGGPGPRPFSGVEEEERSALYFSDLKELCDLLWVSCAPEIVKDNRLNTDALRQYLGAVKAISDKYALTEVSQGRGGMGMSIAFSDGGSATMLPGSLMWYTMQLTHYAAFSTGNLQLLQMMMDRSGSTLELFPGLTPGAWQPSTVVSISADAKNQQFAAELVQAMLLVEVQQLNYGTGLPVTHAGLTAQVDTINERRAENGEEPFSFDPNVLINQLSSPSIRDTVLTDMMWGSVEKCCNGEIDVEGAVKEIEQSVKNYLAERA